MVDGSRFILLARRHVGTSASARWAVGRHCNTDGVACNVVASQCASLPSFVPFLLAVSAFLLLCRSENEKKRGIEGKKGGKGGCRTDAKTRSEKAKDRTKNARTPERHCYWADSQKPGGPTILPVLGVVQVVPNDRDHNGRRADASTSF